MYLAAYQSDLWNGMLSRFLERTLPKEGLTPVSLGRRTVHFFQQLDESLSARLNGKALPLPSARLHDVEESYAEIIRDTLLAEGLELRQLRVKYPRDSFFSKGDRPLLVRLQEFVAVPADDELYPRRRKLTLNFSLPRGSYATIVIKRLFLQANLFNPSP
jgi:tRNA pseudouridine13 synthase